MNRKLYIRFYVNWDSQIPYNSHFVCVSTVGKKELQACMEEHYQAMTDWMRDNPTGKVDFAWLF